MSSVEDVIAKARAIAARLSSVAASGDSELGKRKNRFDENGAFGAGLGSIKSKKLYIPVNEHPEINFLGILIGPRGQTQKQLQESTGAKILIRGRGASKDGGGPDDDDELHVFIEGHEEAVENAVREVQQILHNPEQAMRLKQQQLQSLADMKNPSSEVSIYGPGSEDGYSVELRVPNHMVGLVIGKGGENIQRMQASTGAHMQIAKESDMKPGETLRSIVLKGSPAAVAELKKKVEEVINARSGGVASAPKVGANGMPELSHAVVLKVQVPNDKVGCVIGKGGTTVKGIQERTRAQIQIPPGPDDDNPAVRTLSIGADTKEAADAAHMEIFGVLQMQAQSSAQSAPGNALYIVVPNDMIGLVIGKGGNTIKDIQSRCQVRVQIPHCPDPGTNVRTCSIIGTPTAQHLARYEIEAVIRTQVNSVSELPAGVTFSGGSAPPPSSQYGGGGWGQQAAAVYGGQPASYYGAQAGYGAAAGYGGQAAYGAAAGYATSYPGYDASAYYGQQQQQTQQAAAAPATEVPTDPTAYYNEFWQYTSYYGEAAARQFYGAWSPPEGTPPPASMTAGYTDPAAAASATATGAEATSSSTSATGADASTAESATATSTTPAAESSQQVEVDASDPAAVSAAWDAYKAQYQKWYEEFGKAQGADPNPPQMS